MGFFLAFMIFGSVAYLRVRIVRMCVVCGEWDMQYMLCSVHATGCNSQCTAVCSCCWSALEASSSAAAGPNFLSLTAAG